MWIVDDEFLDRVGTGADPYITTLTVSHDQPYVDIEAVSDLNLSGATSDEFVERFRKLRRPFNESRPCHLLLNCGDLTRDGLTDESWAIWTQARARIQPLVQRLLMVPGNHDVPRMADGSSFYERFTSDLSKCGTVSPRHYDFPVAIILRVCAVDDPESSPPLAYVVVVGFDSNEARYRNAYIENHGQISTAQLVASQRLVHTLATSVSHNTPLYVIGVTHHNILPAQDRLFSGQVNGDRPVSGDRTLDCLKDTVCTANHSIAENTAGGTTNSSAVLAHCREVRMSLLLHAHMQRQEVATLSSTSLVPGRSPAELSVVACPSFAFGSGSAGMARLRLNVWKGEAEIAFSHDLGSDGPDGAIQIVRPLVSASRVAPSERRLYESVGRLITKAMATNAAGVESLAAFKEHVEKTWTDTGYVALCRPDGSLPSELSVTRRTSYFLLLLLRERVGGGYDLLLSNHTPLQPSYLGDWNALLMPAFRSVRILLEHLRADVLRQVVDLAQDLEKATQVRAFEAAVGRILDDTDNLDEDVWADQVREISTFTRTKISPTTGCVTEYEYHLVTLLPFVRRADTGTDGYGTAGNVAARQRQRDYTAIIDWLNELSTISRRGVQGRGPRIPIEVLHVGGGGLRWEPPVDRDTPPLASGERVSPGAVWFPLPDPDDEIHDSPWCGCPAIVTRNADVMVSVDGELRRRRQPDGSFPDELVVGKLPVGGQSIQVVGEQFPFAAPAGSHKATPERPSGSTIEAISKVMFIKDSDLRGQYPYRDLEIKRTYLVRSEITVARVPRTVILVFDADTHDRESVVHAGADSALGVLRPVQRYVMRAGLERAGELYDQVGSKLADEWGFAYIRKGEAPTAVAITPPIVEQLHLYDWEDDRGAGEFILCDGNHRVVELVWKRRLTIPAITVIGETVQPYYAKPFSRFEWNYTAENVQDRSPHQGSKYAVRTVDPSTLDSVSAAELHKRPEKEWYRRYYRDLSTGFGYLGGQGGRYV